MFRDEAEPSGYAKIDYILGLTETARMTQAARRGVALAIATPAGDDETDTVDREDKIDQGHAQLTEYRCTGDPKCLDKAIRLLTAARGEEETDEDIEGGRPTNRAGERKPGDYLARSEQTSVASEFVVSHFPKR